MKNLLKIYKEIEELYGDAFTNQIVDKSVMRTCETLIETLKTTSNSEKKDQINLDVEEFSFRKLDNIVVEQIKKSFEDIFENYTEKRDEFFIKRKGLIQINYGTRRLVIDKISMSIGMKTTYSNNLKSTKHKPFLVGTVRHRTDQALNIDLLRAFI